MRAVWHRRCAISGQKLAEALQDVESPYILNWGVGHAPPDIDTEMWINSPEACAAAADKAHAFATMAAGNARVPDVTLDPDEAKRWITEYGWTMFGRTTNHRAGRGLYVCRTPERVDRSVRKGATHWVRYIEAVHEYRVHVFDRKVIKTSEKVGGEGVVRSKRHGWVFHQPSTSFEERDDSRKQALRAVRALGLIHGAVDQVVDTEGMVYDLEVNTAPSVTSDSATTFDVYLKAITNHQRREE